MTAIKDYFSQSAPDEQAIIATYQRRERAYNKSDARQMKLSLKRYSTY
jgi:hypothetical protein